MRNSLLYTVLGLLVMGGLVGCGNGGDQEQTSPKVIEGTHEILKEGQAAQKKRRQQEEQMRQEILGENDDTTAQDSSSN